MPVEEGALVLRSYTQVLCGHIIYSYKRIGIKELPKITTSQL